MNWEINEEVQSEVAESKFMPVTIEAGRFISNISFESNPQGGYLQIDMVDKEGRTANKRYYPPRIDNRYIHNDADLKKSAMKTLKVITNLARKFLGDDYATPKVDTFEALCKQVIVDIGDKYKDFELRTKIVYNSSNFPSLPTYAPIWEDPKKVPADKTALFYSSVDQTKRKDVQADSEQSVAEGPIWSSE